MAESDWRGPVVAGLVAALAVACTHHRETQTCPLPARERHPLRGVAEGAALGAVAVVGVGVLVAATSSNDGCVDHCGDGPSVGEETTVAVLVSSPVIVIGALLGGVVGSPTIYRRPSSAPSCAVVERARDDDREVARRRNEVFTHGHLGQPCLAGTCQPWLRCSAQDVCERIPAGTEGGRCLPGGACAPGLTCTASYCRAPSAPSTPVAPGP